MTDELIAWLQQQIDEDERAIWAPLQVSRWVADARQVYTVDPEGWEVVNETSTRGVAEHVAHFNPRNQLDEVAAKRAILDLHARVWIRPGSEHFNDAHLTTEPMAICRSCSPETQWRRERSWPCRTIRAQVLAYASRPGYRSEWAS